MPVCLSFILIICRRSSLALQRKEALKKVAFTSLLLLFGYSVALMIPYRAIFNVVGKVMLAPFRLVYHTLVRIPFNSSTTSIVGMRTVPHIPYLNLLYILFNVIVNSSFNNSLLELDLDGGLRC